MSFFPRISTKFFRKLRRNSKKRKNDPRIIMTLLVRNEEDILAENVQFHHNMGVDAFIITNNASTDSTTEIIENLSKDFEIIVINEPELTHNQGAWVTRMAHIAAGELNAAWIIHNDADEFWVPRHGNLKTTLLGIMEETMALVIRRHNAVLTVSKETASELFYKRLSVFEAKSLNDLGKNFPGKISHRASSKIVIGEGNHSFHDENWPTTAFDGIYILHYPKRSLHQFRRKIKLGSEALERNIHLPKQVGSTWRYLNKKRVKGELDALWNSWHCTDSEVNEKLKSGDFFIDYFVRDCLAGATDTSQQNDRD
jgi:hypothetical protein